MYKEKRLFAKHKKKRPKTMSKFINPFTDYGFKLIFGREVSKDLLIEFLNDLLEGERVITDLQFLNNEQLPLYPEGRGIIYDVYCTTDTGEKIIVEMQNRMQSNFKERSIYYLSRAIVNQGRVGNEWKFEIKAVYGVFLMNFIIDKNIKLRTDVILSDRETGELFSDKFREVFIALPLCLYVFFYFRFDFIFHIPFLFTFDICIRFFFCLWHCCSKFMGFCNIFAGVGTGVIRIFRFYFTTLLLDNPEMFQR